MKRVILAVALAVGGLVIAAPAHAGTTCTTTYTGGTLPGPLTVPAGAFCVLNGVDVTGGATVQPGGSLRTFINGATRTHFAAGVNATGAYIGLHDTDVNGSISDVRPTTNGVNPFSGGVCRTSIKGSLSVTGAVSGSLPMSIGSNPGDGFCLPNSGNTVTGGGLISNNQASINLADNTFGGTLACSGNSPAPTGSGNTAASKTGQCSTL
jgi:hexosaminidase